MSGYEGGGTDMGGTDYGGADANYGGGMEYGGWDGMGDLDANIGAPTGQFTGSGLSLAGGTLGLSAAPGRGLELAEASGSPGLSASPTTAAEFAGNVGGANLSHDSATALAIEGAKASIAVTDADIAKPATPPAPAVPAAKSPTLFETIGRGLLGLLGLASGTPQGVIGGAMTLHSAAQGFSASSTTTAPASSEAAGPLAGSPAPDLFAGGGNGPSETTYGIGMAASPVLGYGGAVVNAPAASVPGFPGLGALSYGFVPGGLQSPAGFAGGAPAAAGGGLAALPLLLLAGLSYLVFA